MTEWPSPTTSPFTTGEGVVWLDGLRVGSIVEFKVGIERPHLIDYQLDTYRRWLGLEPTTEGAVWE